MSEDLRYHFFDHEAEEHPFVTADEGWKQMQQLLDKELPNSSKRISGSNLFFFAAALFGFVFLVTALPLETYFEQKEFTTAVKKENSEKSYDNNLTAKGKTLSASLSTRQNAAIISKKTISKNSSIITRVLLPLHNNVNHIVPTFKETIQNEQTFIGTSSEKNSLPEGATIALTGNDAKKTVEQSANTDTAWENNTGQKKKLANINYESWQFYAGAAVNISLNNSFQSLHPYPFAEIKYQFAPTLFVGASVAFFSPVGSKANGIKKTVYVNDTSYNLSNYNETLNYKRLTYADVALTGGIQISKQISVHGGLQLSRLLGSKIETTLDPYDFNMNRLTVTGQDVSTLPTTPSAAPVYNNRIDVKKFDIRYVAGINYELKKFSVGLQYQGGIKPVLTGDAVTADKNKMITLKAAFRFK